MEQTTSPLPKKAIIVNTTEEGFNFFEALKNISIGKKIHKLEWEDRSIYGFMNAGVLSLHKADDKSYQWIISDGDIAGEDYIIIN